MGTGMVIQPFTLNEVFYTGLSRPRPSGTVSGAQFWKQTLQTRNCHPILKVERVFSTY